ncbi:MAG: glycosyltransferase family 4 protein [Candidatus Cloacimonetes bacterium]|nr:glycosyltransferase family 4 protein [Candidatus Cloacimonadota bacterium]
MKIFYLDPNATTPQYSYPVLEELLNQKLDVTFYSTINQYISEYYISTYNVKADYFYFRIANKIKNQKVRKIIKLLSYTCDSLIFVGKIIRNRPDIVHYNWLAIPPIDLIVIKLLKLMNIKVVITRHDFIPHEFRNLQPGDMKCLQLADAIICLSEAIKMRFPKKMQNKITVIPHGNTYEKELLMFPVMKTESDENSLNILLVGNLKPYKGAFLLLQACGELIREGTFPELKLKLSGKCEPALQAQIEEYIQNNELEKYIERVYKFISYEEMFQDIVNCDLGILPYKWGSQSGLPYIFYAFYKPLVLSNVCGLSEQGNDRISMIIEPEINDIKNSIRDFQKKRHHYKDTDFTEFLSSNDIKNVARKIRQLYAQLSA